MARGRGKASPAPAQPRSAPSPRLANFISMLDQGIRGDSEEFWKKLAGAETFIACEEDPDRIVEALIASDLCKDSTLAQKIRGAMPSLCPADERERIRRLRDALEEQWIAYGEVNKHEGAANDWTDWYRDLRGRLREWQAQEDPMASRPGDIRPVGGVFTRGVISQISIDVSSTGDEQMIRDQLSAFWSRWGDPERARRCASMSSEQITLGSRLARARNLLLSGGASIGLRGAFDPLRLDELTQEDLDDQAVNRLSGRRRALAAARVGKNPGRFTEWHQARRDDYLEFERMVIAINRCPESFSQEPGPVSGRCVSVPVSPAGLKSVRDRFDLTALKGEYRIIYTRHIGGTTARLIYRIEAEHEGEPIAVQAVLPIDKQSKAGGRAGLARFFAPKLADVGLSADEISRVLADPVDLGWRTGLGPVEHGELAAGKRDDAPDLRLQDACRHKRAHYGTSPDPDCLRLFCHDCGEDYLAVIPAHRVPSGMPNGLAGIRDRLKDLAAYGDRERAYSLLTGKEEPPPRLHGDALLRWLQRRDGLISHDPQDLVLELIGPPPERVRGRQASSVAAAMSRR